MTKGGSILAQVNASNAPAGGVHLVVHIGSGKTGTTSIQNYLKKSRDELLARGIWYLGLMLEYAGSLSYEWQKPTTVNDAFYRLPSDRRHQELHDALARCISDARASGFESLVWSNESLFDHPDDVIPVLQRLGAEGITVTVVLYLRGHEQWARSAYIQWGIKHKTYKGRLKNFSQWARINLPSFAQRAQKFEEAFAERFVVRNFDAAPEVVTDFFGACGWRAPVGSPPRSNEAPPLEELYLRALLNAQYDEPVLPDRFDRTIGDVVGAWSTADDFLGDLLPSTSDIEWVSDHTSEDRAQLNALLERKGQPLLESDRKAGASGRVSCDKLVHALSRLVVWQAKRLGELDQRVSALEERLKGHRPSETPG